MALGEETKYSPSQFNRRVANNDTTISLKKNIFLPRSAEEERSALLEMRVGRHGWLHKLNSVLGAASQGSEDILRAASDCLLRCLTVY